MVRLRLGVFVSVALLGAAIPARAQKPGETASIAPAVARALDMTALQSSDPQVFATIADRALGIAMKTAVVPSLTGQDTRYVPAGPANALVRVGYAASRTVVARGRLGQTRFNMTEIGGAALSATLSNVYRRGADRSLSGTLTRWGTQVLFDAASNELKEFWPEIRRILHKP